MAVADFLVDSSALNRLGHPSVTAVLAPLIEQARVATTGVLNLEALYSATSPADYERLWSYRTTVFEYLDTDERDVQRALEVQRALAERSSHRGAKLPDLLIAAVAERERITVLHYDADFDLIASVTDQPVEWVVPQGSVP